MVSNKEFVGLIEAKWQGLKSHATAIAAVDPRTVDVLWPLFQYDGVDVHAFTSDNMCLLADDHRRRLLLNQAIVSSIGTQIEFREALHWFWTHQLVHVSQGLSYRTFRILNEETDRMETMRADVWADFISFKTLAIADLLEAGHSLATLSTGTLQRAIRGYYETFVGPMLALNPNLFIPFARDIEVKRILSLLVGGMLTQRLVSETSDDMLDDSLFVNWRESAGEMYIWYGQTSLLARRAVLCDTGTLSRLVEAVRTHDFDAANAILGALRLPEPSEYVDQCRRQLPSAGRANVSVSA